jgi:pyruvate,water dikinase
LSSVFALLEPDWIEDPTIVIEYLKAYVTQPDAGRETDQAARVAEREKAVVDARARLTSYPQPVRDQFETLLKAAQTAAVVHEDHNYWIDQRLFYHVRQLILEFGRRFAETGALDAVDDVFYVTPEELHESREILAGQGEEKAQNRSLQQCVRERKAEMEHYSRVTAPPMLGTMPPFEMDDGGPVLRAFFKGDFNPQENGSSDPGVVNGLAGSAGIVRGKARVIRSLAEAGKLQKWDILVTEFTVPPWTPLFAIAGAIVTDIGGVLSHSAVVAREYRIPAVVGTGHATTTFHDGQLLEVDGNAGMVRAVASA